nr:glutaminase [Microbacterium sp. MAH-37]
MQGIGVAKVSRWRAPRIVRAGEAWHLGVLLLTHDGVLATGEVLRAAEEVRRGYAAESARARADRRAQARRGGFGEGEIVHVGWTELDVAAVDAGGVSGPLLLVDGVPSVRWSAAGVRSLEAYLREQIELRYPGS